MKCIQVEPIRHPASQLKRLAQPSRSTSLCLLEPSFPSNHTHWISVVDMCFIGQEKL